jgi:class 3 adenylate cyclase
MAGYRSRKEGEEKMAEQGRSDTQLALIASAGPYMGQCFPLATLPATIGRKAPNTIVLEKDQWVSSNHCRLYREGKRVLVEDLNSANGTFVNGQRIHAPTVITPGRSTIAIGTTLLSFVTEASAEDRACQTLNFSDLIAGGAQMDTAGRMQGEWEEALFVVDICKSTDFGQRYGEKALLSVVIEIGRIITRYADMDLVRSMQHTGDGFFLSFDSVAPALELALHLVREITKFQPAEGAPNPGVRIAVHYGVVIVNNNGDRLGVNYNLTRKMEGAKAEDRVSGPEMALPLQNRILISGPATAKLSARLSSFFTPVGVFRFPGFDDELALHLVTGENEVILAGLEQE